MTLLTFSTFMGAVVDRGLFRRGLPNISLNNAKKDADAEVVSGGNLDKSKGWLIEAFRLSGPKTRNTSLWKKSFLLLCLTVYVYDDEKYRETLDSAR
ncbi:MAG: hypothetical protein U5L09_01915 [Bacteroidales bacterium]|nr:hypothetical protein [Bacteroidales bacterium]